MGEERRRDWLGERERSRSSLGKKRETMEDYLGERKKGIGW